MMGESAGKFEADRVSKRVRIAEFFNCEKRSQVLKNTGSTRLKFAIQPTKWHKNDLGRIFQAGNPPLGEQMQIPPPSVASQARVMWIHNIHI
jgi:hypothetical protein